MENVPVFRKRKEFRLHRLQNGQFDINTDKALERLSSRARRKGIGDHLSLSKMSKNSRN